MNGKYLTFPSSQRATAAAYAIGSAQKLTLVDRGELAMDPTPKFGFDRIDIDRDGHAELVLITDREDGKGSLMFDPLGIADTMFKAGYEPDDDYLDSLSPTQAASLEDQIGAVVSTVSAAALRTVLESLDGSGFIRTYFSLEFEYGMKGTGYAIGGSNEYVGGSLEAGNYTLHFSDSDGLLPNLEVSASALTVEGSVAGGIGSVSVEFGSAHAYHEVHTNGYMVSGGVDLVSVTVMAGDEDGSYASLSTGVGLGAAAGGSWGRNDQYGATVDVPIIPVGVAVYVKGSDVVDVAEELRDLAMTNLNQAKDVAERAWKRSSKWAKGKGAGALANARCSFNSKKASAFRTGSAMLSVAEDNAGKVFKRLTSSIDSKLDNIGDALRKAADDPITNLLVPKAFRIFNWF